MSINLMSYIWENGPADQGARFVLLAIADHANDDGIAYPSAARIARKCCMDERSVRRIVKRLSDQGWLTVEQNAGPKGCNVFTVHRIPLTHGQGDLGSGVTSGPDTPDHGSAPPLTHGQPNRQLTINEPSEGGALTLTPPAPPAEKPKKPKRATQIGDWRPTEMMIFEAAVQVYGGSSPEAIAKAEQMADTFVDHALDKGRLSKDWSAAWRTWVKKEVDFEDRKRR